MALVIEFDFSDRYEWIQMPPDHVPSDGDVSTGGGYVRRYSLGPGIATTSFKNVRVIENWMKDREAANLPRVPGQLLVAEHLQAGLISEHAPGRVTGIRVTGAEMMLGTQMTDASLREFLESYFGVETFVVPDSLEGEA